MKVRRLPSKKEDTSVFFTVLESGTFYQRMIRKIRIKLFMMTITEKNIFLRNFYSFFSQILLKKR